MLNKSEFLLLLVAEEAMEIAHRASKALRFGLMQIQTGQPYTNAERVRTEINDLYAVLEMFQKEQPFFHIAPDAAHIQKHKEQVLAYMEFSRALGIWKDDVL